MNEMKNLNENSLDRVNVDNNKINMPNYSTLETHLNHASSLVNDIILKNYLTKLNYLEVVPLDQNMKDISDIRLFKINEMVYQKNEYSTYKFSSVFNSVQNLNCGVFIIAKSDGSKTDFYMGVRSFDSNKTTKSLKDTLKNALSGQFSGVKTSDLTDSDAEEFLETIQSKNIVSVSCVANNKDSEFTDNERFIQGFEKLALAMQGQCYTAIVLAKSTPIDQLMNIRQVYEDIYTKISPFANMQVSYGSNNATSISEAFSRGTSSGTSESISKSEQSGESYSKSYTENESTTKTDNKTAVLKAVGSSLFGVASIVTAPLTGGASIVAAAAITAGQVAISSITPTTITEGTSKSISHTTNTSNTESESKSTNEGTNESHTNTDGKTAGTSENIQLTMQNKTIINTLARIDNQLERIEECESIGMWECAAYFLSDTQETAEMAAGTYKALMKGDKSGVEISAINFWGRENKNQTLILKEYIKYFVHPIFAYKSLTEIIPVTPATLVSGNELAIHMGLPRKSVCGFPVIEHANFGQEVVNFNKKNKSDGILLGNVFTMGKETATKVRLDRNSLTMHTFITGSTGSGKSNTLYEILSQLRSDYNVPFLVIEPAKGEYKNIFGQYKDVSVYGTNQKKFDLLRLNPFKFPTDIHVLEHLDRLVELFNVCWPMYAAMPAILKEGMELSYIEAGWDLITSENSRGNIYPNFTDLLLQIENVINDSKYSGESKGNYTGALCTRIRSLTNGINGMIFTSDDLSDEDLFDKNVIVDLSRIGSSETKSLIMGLLVMKLSEYRMTFGKMNSPLKHVTVLEEAHNLLKRTSSDQASESSNLLGKSVELLSNAIAEMRTYGEGFIIADQSPGLLDMSVIRNTNTKIILHLPEHSDRELVGLSASLNDEQIDELSKLERGVAAVYQNDWIEPVLVKIGKCEIEELTYEFDCNYIKKYAKTIRQQLILFLIQGRVTEKLDFDVDEIERNIHILNLSYNNNEFVSEMIEEYREYGHLMIWDNSQFNNLATNLNSLLNTRNTVLKYILSSVDNLDITEKLNNLSSMFISLASKNVILTLSQCFMKDSINQHDETENLKKIYMAWIDNVNESENVV